MIVNTNMLLLMVVDIKRHAILTERDFIKVR